jgi:hypothetical protein
MSDGPHPDANLPEPTDEPGSASRSDVTARLEALDDVIFPAIEGCQQALAEAEPAWKQTVAELGPGAVQESRREYLRYARSTWEFLRRQATINPFRLFAVLKIIGLLMGDDV